MHDSLFTYLMSVLQAGQFCRVSFNIDIFVIFICIDLKVFYVNKV